MESLFAIIKNVSLLTALMIGFSHAQTGEQQTGTVTQNPSDISVQKQILQQLKSIDNRLAVLDQIHKLNKITSENINKKFININEGLEKIDIILNKSYKQSENVNEFLHGETSTSEANLYYLGIGLEDLINEIKIDQCKKIPKDSGDNEADKYRSDCAKLKKKAKDLESVANFVLGKSPKKDVKMMLQDRIQIINRIHEILLMENEKLQIMVDRYKEEKKQKEQDKQDRETLSKLSNEKAEK